MSLSPHDSYPYPATPLSEKHRHFQPRFTEHEPTLVIHEAALQEAGFREVSTIWQRFDDRILLAVR